MKTPKTTLVSLSDRFLMAPWYHGISSVISDQCLFVLLFVFSEVLAKLVIWHICNGDKLSLLMQSSYEDNLKLLGTAETCSCDEHSYKILAVRPPLFREPLPFQSPRFSLLTFPRSEIQTWSSRFVLLDHILQIRPQMWVFADEPSQSAGPAHRGRCPALMNPYLKPFLNFHVNLHAGMNILHKQTQNIDPLICQHPKEYIYMFCHICKKKQRKC